MFGQFRVYVEFYAEIPRLTRLEVLLIKAKTFHLAKIFTCFDRPYVGGRYPLDGRGTEIACEKLGVLHQPGPDFDPVVQGVKLPWCAAVCIPQQFQRDRA